MQHVSKLLQTNVALNIQRSVDMHFFQKHVSARALKEEQPKEGKKEISEDTQRAF